MARRRRGQGHDHRRGHACPVCPHGHERSRKQVYVRTGTVKRGKTRYLYAIAVRRA